MRVPSNPRLALVLLALFALPETASLAQSQNEAAVLVGQGVFLRGAGSYNLNTAKAASVNTDTVIRWKQDLRKIAAERRELQAVEAAGKKAKIEDVKRRLQEHDQELRVSPTPADIENGQALNALLYDLTDPNIPSAEWETKVVQLPIGMSVKDLIFRFMPASNSVNASKALSRGVIALSRLDIEGKWPTAMQLDVLEKERRAFETAYTRLRDQLYYDKFDLKTLLDMDRSLDALKAKAETAVPTERGYREEAVKFVEELKDATRMFDAATVDYATEILVDTKDRNATTVAELVSFMLKYRLQFATAGRSPTGRLLYRQLYELLQQQTKLFQIAPGEGTSGTSPEASLEADKFLKQYGAACEAADRSLLKSFDKQIEIVRKQPKLKAEEKQAVIEFIKVEKATYEQHGTIPFSPMMRDDVLSYLKALADADAQAGKMYDKAIEHLTIRKDDVAAADKLAEKKKVLAPKIIGRWRLIDAKTKQVHLWFLNSNGTFHLSNSTWRMDKTRIVARHPNSAAPGGAWFDTCVFDTNGQTLHMTNQLGVRFDGVRFDPQ